MYYDPIGLETCGNPDGKTPKEEIVKKDNATIKKLDEGNNFADLDAGIDYTTSITIKDSTGTNIIREMVISEDELLDLAGKIIGELL